jgi:3-phytase
MNFGSIAIIFLLFFAVACRVQPGVSTSKDDSASIVKPLYISGKVAYDADDPAIWINKQDPARSLIIGTDKDVNGALYVFDLKGNIIPGKTVKGLKRPNNVDIEYGLMLNGTPVDIAVTTERFTHQLRVYSLPDMKEIDNGGLEMFSDDQQPGYRDLMGISLYKNKIGNVYAFVGRKTGPAEGYLGQYLLDDDGTGNVKSSLVRTFGSFSGKKEIESIAVDDALGYVYYSDEGVGVKQYYADAEKGNAQLALFGTTGFKEDHEGISIYQQTDSTGYILVSDQGANRFQIFSREGVKHPYDHQLLKVVNVAATQSDGSEVVALPLGPDFPKGLFVVMSNDRTFHLYKWEDIAGKEMSAIP